jgi:hypothetical protein
MDTSISVARLAALGVPLTWQEAVAVVAQAAEAMTQSGLDVLPETCVLDTTGTIAIAGTQTHGGKANGVVAILAVLLEGTSAPAELRALLTPPPGDDRLETFTTSLAFFERPNRRSDVSAVAARGVAADAKASADAELERIRRSSPAEAPRTRQDFQNAQQPPRRGGHRVVMAAAGIAIIAALVLGIQLARRPASAATAAAAEPTAVSAGTAPETTAATGSGDPAAAPESVASGSVVDRLVSAAANTLGGVADAGLRALGVVPASSTAAAEPPTPAPASPAAAAGRPRGTKVARSDAAATLPAAAPPSPAPATAVPAATPPEVSDDAPLAVDESADVVFTEDDADVEPPLLVRPQLPREPRNDASGTNGFLELLVNERGQVEQVRLRGEPSLLRDRMLVSAAKAWQFRPAVKDGRPVRYVVRVPITQ